ncbi:putative glycosyltransferase EpsE [compost metagenome]
MAYSRIHQLVSVVIPCYNAVHYIEECLDHLSGQSYKNMEIIVVDDHSTDRSAEIVDRWRMRTEFTRLTLLQMPQNVGFSGALTSGFFLAQGEYIAIHDADDFSHPDRLQKQVDYLNAHPDIDFVGTNYMAFEDENASVQTLSNWLSYGEDIISRYAQGDHCVSHPTAMFRASSFDKIGGLTRNMNGAEDYEYVAKFIQNGYGVENLPDVLYYYRLHSNQRSREFY